MIQGDLEHDPVDLDAQVLEFNQSMMSCSEIRFFNDGKLAHNQKYKEMQTDNNNFYPSLHEFK